MINHKTMVLTRAAILSSGSPGASATTTSPSGASGTIQPAPKQTMQIRMQVRLKKRRMAILPIMDLLRQDLRLEVERRRLGQKQWGELFCWLDCIQQ
ncbi:hypothetical protein AL066_06790 [Pseudomonas nunensis]|nr:hypothetical protein AL066_06790 [Pseudomonas nunensis]